MIISRNALHNWELCIFCTMPRRKYKRRIGEDQLEVDVSCPLPQILALSVVYLGTAEGKQCKSFVKGQLFLLTTPSALS